MSTPSRGGNGKFTRTLKTAERDAEACKMRARGATYQVIADALGFTSRGNAQRAVEKLIRSVEREGVETAVALQLERLDMMYDAVIKVLEAEHYVVSQGRLIYLDEDSPPLADDSPVLTAVDRLLKIEERRSRLLGLDQPAKATVTHAAADVDAAVSELAREMALRPPVPLVAGE